MRDAKSLTLAEMAVDAASRRRRPSAGDGVRRAAVRWAAKIQAHPPMIQTAPSRQVLRRQELKRAKAQAGSRWREARAANREAQADA